MYGCDVKYKEGERPNTSSYAVITITNLVVMIISYGIVLWKVKTTKDEEDQPLKRPISHTSMVFFLSVTYAFCTLPVVFLSWNQVCVFVFFYHLFVSLWVQGLTFMDTNTFSAVRHLFNAIYWSMHGKQRQIFNNIFYF